MEIRINKEVRNYQESIVFGLSLRQTICSILAILVAVGVYFWLKPMVGEGQIGGFCIIAALPFAVTGFFHYNSMPFEKFLRAIIRTEIRTPRQLVYKSDNLYVKALESLPNKEVFIID